MKNHALVNSKGAIARSVRIGQKLSRVPTGQYVHLLGRVMENGPPTGRLEVGFKSYCYSSTVFCTDPAQHLRWVPIKDIPESVTSVHRYSRAAHEAMLPLFAKGKPVSAADLKRFSKPGYHEVPNPWDVVK